MKKILIIAIAVLGLVSGVNAQTKFGYVNAAEILYLMPEMKKVQDSLLSFQKELEGQYQLQMNEYSQLIKKYEDQQKNGASQTMLQLTQDEIAAKEQFLTKSQTAYQEAIIEAESSLVKPLNDKIMKAIKEVAAERGMNYIFDISKGAILHWDEKDDVGKDMRKKLGISETATLPKEGQ